MNSAIESSKDIIMNCIKKVLQKPIFITISSFILVIIIQVFFGVLNDTFLHISTQNPIDKYSWQEKFFLGVILAPIIETFIFQYLPFKVIGKVIKNPVYIIMGSSLFFAFNHYYNWLYVVVTFFIGLILNCNYYAVQKISKYGFWLTALLHAANNSLAFLAS